MKLSGEQAAAVKFFDSRGTGGATAGELVGQPFLAISTTMEAEVLMGALRRRIGWSTITGTLLSLLGACCRSQGYYGARGFRSTGSPRKA